MVTLLTTVSSSEQLENLHKSLELNLPDFEVVGILCYTASAYLCHQTKIMLNQVLLDYEGSVAFLRVKVAKKDPYSEAREFVSPNEFLLIWENEKILHQSELLRLISSYKDFPRAGLISSRGGYLVGSIYEPKTKQESQELNIDTASFSCIATRGVNFITHYNIEDFGLNLRRVGYENKNISEV